MQLSSPPLSVLCTLLVAGCSESTDQPQPPPAGSTDAGGPMPQLPSYYLKPDDLTSSVGQEPPYVQIQGIVGSLSPADRAEVEAALTLVDLVGGTAVDRTIAVEEGAVFGGSARFTLVPDAPLSLPWYAIRFTLPPGMLRVAGETGGRAITGGHESRFAPGSAPVLRKVFAHVKGAAWILLGLSEWGTAVGSPGDAMRVTEGGRVLACDDLSTVGPSGEVGSVTLSCPAAVGETIEVHVDGDALVSRTGAPFRTFSGQSEVDVTLTLESAEVGPGSVQLD